jgi:hypothetical protein
MIQCGIYWCYDYTDQTWEWDGETWAKIETGAENPGLRDHFAMAYDAAREQMVTYAGTFFPDRTFYSDTWVWDGGTWTQAATTGLDVRYHYAMAYDPLREQVLLFGGTKDGINHNDLWAWDGEEWGLIDDGTGPSPRPGARMAFDEAAGVMVLFGGQRNLNFHADTWLWDGETWTEFETETFPSARSHHAMAYDRIRQKVVLFGGYDNERLSDTWEWDLTNGWTDPTAD